MMAVVELTPRNEFRKGGFGIAQERQVVVRHFNYTFTLAWKVTDYFCVEFFQANADAWGKLNSNEPFQRIFENNYCVTVRIK
jgi:hypothetical protein